MTSQLTVEEMAESLTGYDEIALEKHFGADLNTLAGSKPNTLLRGLIAIEKSRTEGIDLVAAKSSAMELTLRDVTGYFAADDEIDSETPETDAGKGDSQPA